MLRTILDLIGTTVLRVLVRQASLAILCTQALYPQCQGKPDLVIFALFDNSQHAQIRDRQVRSFEDVLYLFHNPRPKTPGEKPRYGGEVLIRGNVISRRNIGGMPIDGCFAGFSWTSNPIQHREQAGKTLKNIQSQLAGVLAGNGDQSNGDIIGALQMAERVFQGDGANTSCNKDLLLFSDMVQTVRYDFRTERLSNDRILEIIDIEQKGGRLPSLKGVKVWIEGGSASLDSAKASDIETFWIEYFRRASAQLLKPRYGTGLANYRAPEEEGMVPFFGTKPPCPGVVGFKPEELPPQLKPGTGREPLTKDGQQSPLPRPKIEAFAAKPALVEHGESVLLAWSVVGAEVVRIEPEVGLVDPQGERRIVPPIGKSLYGLIATTGEVTVTSEVEVVVRPPVPRIVYFEVVPASVKLLNKVVLRWGVEDADHVEIQPDVGVVDGTGQQEVTPYSRPLTKYTLKAQGAGGNAEAAVEVQVHGPW